MSFATLSSLRDLTAQHVEDAASAEDRFRELFVRAAEISRPDDGASKLLLAIARIARGDLVWIAGRVVAELAGDDAKTTLEVFDERGSGARRRLAPRTTLAVPLDEFQRAVEMSGKRFAPLVGAFGGDILVLSGELGHPPGLPLPLEPEPFSATGRGSAPPLPLVSGPSAGEPAAGVASVHSRPTVRRMVAIEPDALRANSPGKRRDPRREDDD